MEQFGKYTLVRKIGTGGMAEVYLARTAPKVIPKQHYHWKIERTGKTIRRWVTPAGTPPVVEPFLTYD
ncbi:MAG: hypothetical protein NT062_10885, partial [Proteobacteria bacterium]|nr:hypothetical protein [Pseudomonadota bacterium]